MKVTAKRIDYPASNRFVLSVLYLDVPRSGRDRDVHNAVVATAEGYAFPTNLDRDQPIGSLAPPSQVDLVLTALESDYTPTELDAALSGQAERRIP